MPEKNYLSVDEVACAMGISKSYAYKIVRKLNIQIQECRILCSYYAEKGGMLVGYEKN